MPAAGRIFPPPSVFDRHILSLDVGGFAQSPVERSHRRSNRARAIQCRSRSPVSLLLRAQCGRPSYCRAQEKHQPRGGLLDRQIARFGAGENPAYIGPGLAIHAGEARSAGQQLRKISIAHNDGAVSKKKDAL